jgi:hypothetical protein
MKLESLKRKAQRAEGRAHGENQPRESSKDKGKNPINHEIGKA